MNADHRALADLAASVADGNPVDWQGIESKAGDAERRLVRHLRLVENISSLYRSIPADEDEEFVSAPPVPEPTGPRWGRLVMLDQIGRGSSGDVLRAWDTELHREVALKLLKDGLAAGSTKDTHTKVLQEARRLARVRHAHVVEVYGAEEHDGQVGLWMELVRGESLEQIVAARGPFGAAEAGVIGQDLCAALAAVHKAGLLHRDVKAQNVIRESGGRTVLMDFGTGEELRRNTGTARMAGTPLYLAPEIFRGQPASVESDLYALGVLLFYLVTGQFPVAAGSLEQLAQAHTRNQRRRLRDLRPDLSSSFVAVVERALDPDAASRYHTAGEMEAALRESLNRSQQPADAEAPPARSIFGRRPFLVAGVLAGAVVAAVAAIVWSAGDRARPVASRAITSVAILPLADVSSPPQPGYFADSLTDQLIARLGQIESLRVVSRTSVLPFKDARPSMDQIFGALGVDAVVEGTVAVSPEASGRPGRVRVNARLISAGGSVLWSRTFDRVLGETLALEADVAKEVAAGVRATVTPEERERLTQVRSTNPAAEQAYFRGLNQLNQLGVDNIRASIEAFKRAIEFDSSHAPAHAGLARSHITLGFMRVITQAEARVSALAAASRAAELDPDSSAAHEVLADLKFYYDWDWPGAEASYRKAIDLNPSSDRARFSVRAVPDSPRPAGRGARRSRARGRHRSDLAWRALVPGPGPLLHA